MNITYDIIEKETDISGNIYLDNNFEYNNDSIIALQVNYDLNYNYSYLCNILEFYKIKKTNNKKNMNKDTIIKKIVEFETNPINKSTVEERIKLFSNFIELKNHKFFNKFIISTF